MLESYIEKLIQNLTFSEKKESMHLILDGGIFNGSYLVGALCFLKEMEKRGYIKIDKISGCSIGSICAFLYFINRLDMVTEIYQIVIKDLKENHHIQKINEIGEKLREKTPDNICDTINGKLFITYYNMKKGKKMVKCKYTCKEQVIDVILRSCFVPFLIDGNLLYREKYVDGMNPYVFQVNHKKKVKILYLDLFGYDKISYLLNVKNEKTNFHRVLTGLLDIHNFFIKQSATPMCSYVEEWGLYDWIRYRVKFIIENIIIQIIYLLLFLKKHLYLRQMKSSLLVRFFSKIVYEFYILLLETYSL